MAFYVQTDNGVVKDNNGVRVEATSYCSVAFADAYLLSHGREGENEWNTLSNDAKESHLNNGKIYIDTRFANNLIGTKLNMQVDGESVYRQFSLFPRLNLIGRDGIDYSSLVPLAVMYANAEYAVRSALGKLWLDNPLTLSGGSQGDTTIDTTTNTTSTTTRGAIKSRTLGPLTEEFFAPGTRQSIAEYHLTNNRSSSPDTHDVNPYPQADSLLLNFTSHNLVASGAIGTGNLII